MGELVPRHDPVAIERARREVGNPALSQALVDMALLAERASAYGTRRLVERTEAEENEQVFMYRAEFTDALIIEMNNQIGGAYRDAAEAAREVVRNWGNGRY